LEAEDDIQGAVKHAVRAVDVTPISIPAVEAVFVASTEALPKVVVVVGPLNVIAVVAEVGVLIGVAVLVAETPMILSVGLASPEAFLIAVVHGLSKKIGAVLIRLVVTAATIVAIARHGDEERIVIVVGVMVVEIHLLLMQPPQIVLVETVLRRAFLLLQLHGLPLEHPLLLIQMLTVLGQALLLLHHKLLLALL
jgi:hypothetical protein